MSPELATLIEHGGLVVAMWLVIQTVLVPMITRLMNRLDAVTDRLFEIAQHQETIITQQARLLGDDEQ